jgi:hypothetical protein
MAITGSCHCGSTSFEIKGEIPRELTRCTCSLCSKAGRLIAYYRPDQFRLTSAPDKLGTYRWNTKQIANYYCPVCGCNAFADSPAYQQDGTWDGRTRRIGVNARLFDNFDAATAPITVIDGKNLW